MYIKKIYLKFRALTILVLILFCNSIHASDKDSMIDAMDAKFDIVQSSFLLPSTVKKWKFKHAVSLHMVSLPKDWLESNVNIPLPTYSFRLQMPAGFAAEASISSIIISNQFIVGPKWVYSIGHFHAGFGNDFNFNIGWLDGYGFDNSLLMAWQLEPNLSMGVHFNQMALTFSFKTHYLMNYEITNGGTSHNQSRNTFNGYSFGIHMEQRLWKDRVVWFGFVSNSNRFHIMAWPVFNPVKSLYFIPQLNFGLNFK